MEALLHQTIHWLFAPSFVFDLPRIAVGFIAVWVLNFITVK